MTEGRRPGRFITVEGGEGAGKSTQIDALCNHIERLGFAVLRTREPGGTPGAEAIRDLLVRGDTDRWDPMTEALLHYAARRDHVAKKIKPALASGTWVVCDRFADSTMAYQGYGHGLGGEAIALLDAIALDGFKPDLTLILDIPVTVGLDRAGKRGGDQDRYERMGGGFHDRVRAAFTEIAKLEPERCHIVDAAPEADAVRRRLLAVVDAWLDREGLQP